MQPAIDYATEGFAFGRFRYAVLLDRLNVVRGSKNASAIWLDPNQDPWPIDHIYKQPALANTLLRLSEDPMRFYTGDIAEEIAADMAKNQGYITLADLHNVKPPPELPALNIIFGNWTISTSNPPCGGWVAALILQMLDLAHKEGMQMTPGTIIQAERLGHNERYLHPTESIQVAQKYLNSGTLAANLWNNRQKNAFESHENSDEKEESETGETTHFSIVDKDGNTVATTQSVSSYFGAGAITGSLGFLYNTYMRNFNFVNRSSAFYVAPNKQPLSNMSPTIAASNDGKKIPLLVLGSPGSSRIISAVASIVSTVQYSKLSIETAVSNPRVHTAYQNKLFLEDQKRFSGGELDSFRALGFDIQADYTPSLFTCCDGALNAYFGGVHALKRTGTAWAGAADPRRDGTVQIEYE